MTMPNDEFEEEPTRIPLMLPAEPKRDPQEDPRENLSDLTGMDDYDRNVAFGTSGVLGGVEEDDLSDLVEVDNEDIMGVKPEESNARKQYKITRSGRNVNRYPPPTSLGGVNY